MALLLLLKLGLTPSLIGLATLVSRRWGPALGGLLIALPLNSGPVLLVLALEQGPPFSADAAEGALTGAVAVTSFCVMYAWVGRGRPWWLAYGAALAAYAIASVVARPLVGGPVWLLIAVAAAAPTVGLRLLPPTPPETPPVPLPRWELPVRMLVGVVLIVGITTAATVLGPENSGLLATFPVFITVLAVFTHRREGTGRADQLLKGALVGTFGTIAFLSVIRLTIVDWGIVVAFAVAIVAALGVQGVGLVALRRR